MAAVAVVAVGHDRRLHPRGGARGNSAQPREGAHGEGWEVVVVVVEVPACPLGCPHLPHHNAPRLPRVVVVVP